MDNERFDDPRGEIIGSEYVVPLGAGLRDTSGFREPIRPAPRVMSAEEKCVLRRNRDMFFVAESQVKLDAWLWEPKRQCWVKQTGNGGSSE